MNDEPMDLRPLDPTRDAARYERAIGRIMDRAARPLAARRSRTGTINQVRQWWRPMLAFAAAVAIAALGVLTQVAPASASGDGGQPGVAEAIGIPGTVATWMAAEELPSAAQVFSAFEEAP